MWRWWWSQTTFATVIPHFLFSSTRHMSSGSERLLLLYILTVILCLVVSGKSSTRVDAAVWYKNSSGSSRIKKKAHHIIRETREYIVSPSVSHHAPILLLLSLKTYRLLHRLLFQIQRQKKKMEKDSLLPPLGTRRLSLSLFVTVPYSFLVHKSKWMQWIFFSRRLSRGYIDFEMW
jgi:hypothetical protein